jgi:SAM-dependent methyltransferase
MAEQAIPTNPSGQDGQSVDYGSYYFRHDCGIPYERNEHWLNFFGEIADKIIRDLRPASVLDAGCAMGFLVEALRERGVEAYGVDISEYAISQVHESVSEFCEVRSLADGLPRRYDLIVSIEVLEHIPPAETSAAIANLCGASDRLLLSTTPDDYAEATHLNVQPAEAWSAALAAEGFFRDVDRNTSYVTPWAALYTRTGDPLPETVRRYDRSWVRLRREADQLRGSLLSAQEQLAEYEAQPGGGRPELLARIDAQQEEVMRLRDILIGKDAELGAAKGRLAGIDERVARLTALKQRIASKIPGLGPLMDLALSFLRGL